MNTFLDQEYMPVIKEHYPEFAVEDGWHVESATIELNALDEPDIRSRAFEIEQESIENGHNFYIETAIDIAVEELVIKSRPPRNWIFVRLVKENQKKRVLLIIPTLNYRIPQLVMNIS